MSDIERLLEQALRPPGTSPPPPDSDLFERVVGSVADDRLRRRALRRAALGWIVGLAAGTGLILTLTPRRNGDLVMPWWILEVATTLVLVAIALWLGPFIKRFGRAYAADVFHDNPQTGKSYIVLTDIVYYLIFTAYILFTAQLTPPAGYAAATATVTAEQLTVTLTRLGGILLIIGVLHGLNIVLMPVLGRLFSLNRRLPRD